MSKAFWKAVALSLATVLTFLVLITVHILSPQATVAAEPQIVAQVTSVSQLSDVRPTDEWFSPLQNLVERYGCVTGLPDGTFRAYHTVARGELVSTLSACLDRVMDVIVASSVSQDDIQTTKRLLEEMAQEVARLRR